MLAEWLAAGALFVAALALIGRLRRRAVRGGRLEEPNARSSHATPTPSGGGLAIVAGSLLAAAAPAAGLFAGGAWHWRASLALFLGGLAIAALGWLDDARRLAPLPRVAVQGGVALACVLALGAPPVQFGPWTVAAPLAVAPLAVVAAVWFLNLFNFMDGIDGLAAVETLCVALGALWVLSATAPAHPAAVWAWLLLPPTCAFLVWNWPPAALFMGNAASAYIGFLFAMLAVWTARDGVMNVWSWLILFGVFATDATLTLARRLARGERVYEAHCKHGYQCLARLLQARAARTAPELARARAHRAVSAAAAAVNLLWLAPLALAAARHPAWGAALAALALAPLAVVVARAQKAAGF